MNLRMKKEDDDETKRFSKLAKLWSLLSISSYYFLCFEKFSTTLLWFQKLDFMNLKMKKEYDDEIIMFSKSGKKVKAYWAYQIIIFYILKKFQQLCYGLKTWFHEFKNEKWEWWWDKKVQQIGWKVWSLLNISSYYFLFRKFFNNSHMGLKTLNSLTGLKTWFHEFKNEKGGWWWEKKIK